MRNFTLTARQIELKETSNTLFLVGCILVLIAFVGLVLGNMGTFAVFGFMTVLCILMDIICTYSINKKYDKIYSK